MTEEEKTTDTEQQAKPEESANPSAEAKQTDQQHMIPKSRFDEVNNKYREMLANQEKLATEQAKADKEKLEKQQEFQKLYEQERAEKEALLPFKSQWDSVVASTTERNAKRIESVPKNMRSLVPEYDDPMKLAAWLDNNQAVFAKPSTPSLNGGSGSKERKSSTPAPDAAKIREMAARLGVSAKDMAAQYGVKLD